MVNPTPAAASGTTTSQEGWFEKMMKKVAKPARMLLVWGAGILALILAWVFFVGSFPTFGTSGSRSGTTATTYSGACSGEMRVATFSRKGEVRSLNPGLRCKIEFDIEEGAVSILDHLKRTIVQNVTPSMRGVHCNPCNMETFRANTDKAVVSYRLVPIPAR